MKRRSMIFNAPEAETSFAAGAAAVLAGLPPEENTPSEQKVIIDPLKKEEPPPLEKKEPPVQTEDFPENLPNEGRSEAWKKFRGVHAEQRKELTEAKAQLSDFEGTKKERDELKSRIEALDGELKGYKEIDSIVKLENSPSFKREFVEPRNQAQASLKEFAGYAGVDPASIQTALALTGKPRFDALEEILGNVPTVLRGKMERVIDQLETLDSKMAQERANAETSIRERETRTQTQERETREEFHRKAMAAFDDSVKEFGLDPKSPEALAARKVFENNNDIRVAAKAFIRDQLHDATVAEKAALKKQLEEAQAELERYRKGSPGLNGGTGDRSGITDSKLSFIDGAKRALQGI